MLSTLTQRRVDLYDQHCYLRQDIRRPWHILVVTWLRWDLTVLSFESYRFVFVISRRDDLKGRDQCSRGER